jgi:hypothetical protein
MVVITIKNCFSPGGMTVYGPFDRWETARSWQDHNLRRLMESDVDYIITIREVQSPWSTN